MDAPGGAPPLRPLSSAYYLNVGIFVEEPEQFLQGS